jgi:hypothetical protein
MRKLQLDTVVRRAAIAYGGAKSEAELREVRPSLLPAVALRPHGFRLRRKDRTAAVPRRLMGAQMRPTRGTQMP